MLFRVYFAANKFDCRVLSCLNSKHYYDMFKLFNLRLPTKGWLNRVGLAKYVILEIVIKVVFVDRCMTRSANAHGKCNVVAL